MLLETIITDVLDFPKTVIQVVTTSSTFDK